MDSRSFTRVRAAAAAAVAVVAALGLAGCEGSCGPSPVPKTQTVFVRGTAEPRIGLVKMVNRAGMADRTAGVGREGRYEFAWTGADLTGFFGERSFYLQAPAEPGADLPNVVSQAFVVRADVEMPHLALWDADVRATATPDGGLEVRWRPVQGEGFQRVTGYAVHFSYKTRETVEREGKREVQVVDRSASESGRTDGASIAPAALAGGRCSRGIDVWAVATGTGGFVDLTYRSATARGHVPLPAGIVPVEPPPLPDPPPPLRSGTGAGRAAPAGATTAPAAAPLPRWAAIAIAGLACALVLALLKIYWSRARAPAEPMG